MRILFYISIAVLLFGCSQKQTVVLNEEHLQFKCIEDLNEVIVYDIYSPPVASRIYAYCNLAYYETIIYSSKSMKSITASLKDFSRIDMSLKNNGDVDFNFAATVAFFTIAKTLCFSKDSVALKLKYYEDYFENKLTKQEYTSSVEFGKNIAAVILKRAASDNYKTIKGLPKYTVVKQNNSWEQTPPDYADAIEPNWFLLQPMLIDSTNMSCALPPMYNEAKESKYYKEVMEVFEISKARTLAMDSTAKYWDDNPFVTEHKGHFTAATKKITPGGHWLGIASIICKQKKVGVLSSAKAIALTSCAIYDGFIACWHMKYKTKMPRPITIIRKLINPNWNAYLQTPPFPEYTSGHSVISSAAASVLTNILGNNISFVDSTEYKYLGLIKSFPSIDSAANQAGVSRIYGGIHYRSAVENGKQHGKKIGELYNEIFK